MNLRRRLDGRHILSGIDGCKVPVQRRFGPDVFIQMAVYIHVGPFGGGGNDQGLSQTMEPLNHLWRPFLVVHLMNEKIPGDFIALLEYLFTAPGAAAVPGQEETVGKVGIFLIPVVCKKGIPPSSHRHFFFCRSSHGCHKGLVHLVPYAYGVDKGTVHIKNDGISLKKRCPISQRASLLPLLLWRQSAFLRDPYR